MVGRRFLKQTIRDVPLERKTVLVRADYNVPLNKDGTIRDDFRIRASLPTLRYLLDNGCRVVIVSHLGRPKGAPNKKYSLEVVATHLSTLLEEEVQFVDECIGDRAYQAVKRAPRGSVILLENVRFHPEEEQNDEAFARKIAKASCASYFVQDGFGVVHRAHASTSAITQFIPSVAGLLLEREYTALVNAVEAPKRPLTVILGGAKVSDKIPIIQRFVYKADTILVGGAMANTLLAYQGKDVGTSVHETDQRDIIDTIYSKAKKRLGKDSTDDFIVVPADVAVAKKIDERETRRTVPVDAIAKDDIALDIGEETINRYDEVIRQSGTVIWNGPVGYAELDNFAHGSARLALALATEKGVESIIGGGDTADFVLKWDGQEGGSFTHVSTGGGAGLELMAGMALPGVEVLLDARR